MNMRERKEVKNR